MRVGVTGASGHLGGTLVRQLLADSHDVVAMDLRRSLTLEGLDIDFRTVDILDTATLSQHLDSVDVLCHLAAVISVVGDPTGIVRKVNVTGAGSVADAALSAGIGRMVHCSSVHAFDLANATEPLDESGIRSEGDHLPLYDRSKWAGERAVQQRVANGLDAVVVNPTGVIGPFDFAPSRMGQIFLALRDGRLPATVDGGFDWVDVRDVASGIRSAIGSGRTGENYLLSGRRVEIKDVAAAVSEATGTKAPKLTVPKWAARAWGPAGTWLARRNESALSMTSESLHALFNSPEVSSMKAESELGYSARPFEESVADIYDFFNSQGM